MDLKITLTDNAFQISKNAQMEELQTGTETTVLAAILDTVTMELENAPKDHPNVHKTIATMGRENVSLLACHVLSIGEVMVMVKIVSRVSLGTKTTESENVFVRINLVKWVTFQTVIQLIVKNATLDLKMMERENAFLNRTTVLPVIPVMDLETTVASVLMASRTME